LLKVRGVGHLTALTFVLTLGSKELRDLEFGVKQRLSHPQFSKHPFVQIQN
jgi:hypothetical protein